MNVISNVVKRNEKSHCLDFSLSVEMTINVNHFILKVDMQLKQQHRLILS